MVEADDENQVECKPITYRIARVLQPISGEGNFGPTPALSRQVAAALMLSHTSGEQIRAGRVSTPDTTPALRSRVPRLRAPDPAKP